MAYTSDKKPGALVAATVLGDGDNVVVEQSGAVKKATLSQVEGKVFAAKTQTTSPSGTEVTIVRLTDGNLRQVPLANIVPALNITNAQISNSAAIADTKLATINTAGKVTNQAVQAVATNTANRIVTRDGSGNFAAGTITATLSGNATTATSATTLQTGRTIALTGDVTGTTGTFNGSANVSAATTIANNAVTTAKIADANVTTAKIADANVTTAKILDANVTTAKIADSAVTSAKIADGTIVNADINGSAAIALSKLATGALPTGITVASANIVDGTIVNGDISASAAIALSKLATGALPTAITVASSNIVDGTIVNGDISASAAIAGTKISPNFGSQGVVTTGGGLFGTTSFIDVFSGSTDGISLENLGTVVVSKNNAPVAFFRRRLGNGSIVTFTRDTTEVGNISVTTTATAYNTSSDYRLKENPQPMVGALARLADVKPVTFTWKSNGEQGEGFIAHELQAVVPEAVTGQKDAVDANGSPKYQGVDASKLVPILVAALQELSAKVAALEEAE